MNLGRVNVTIRQRTVLECVDLALPFSFRLARRAYRALALRWLLPAFFACALARYLLAWHWVWVWLLALSLAMILQGPFTLAAGRAMFDESVDAAAVSRQFRRRLIPYSFTLLLTRSAIALGSLSIVLLPMLWVRLAHVHEVLLLEGASMKNAWSRSAGIVRFHGGSAAQMLLCILSMQFAAILVAELLGLGIFGYLLQLGSPFGILFEDGGSPYALLGLFLSVPLTSTARFLTYIDGRTRRDAWDVQVRFQGIRADAGATV